MEQNHEALFLAKPRMKGVLGILFSRLPIILLLLALQVFLFVAVFRWARQYLPHFAVFESAFTVVMVIYLFNSRMDTAAKLTWMWVLALAPLAGAGLLLYTRTDLGHRRIQQRTEELMRETRGIISQDPEVREALADDPCGTDDLCRYLNLSGCFPIYAHTQARYFPSGEAKFRALLEELEKAERFIFLEYFIIEEGYMWGRALEILRQKAAAGVDVRVMYDGMCEINHLPYNYPRRLESLGIRAKSFAPVAPLLSTHYNYRDHRKILVIDGRVAFTGGVNLADEYINRTARFGHWKDAAVMLRGPAAESFTLMFLQMWNIAEKEEDFRPLDEIRPEPMDAEGFVLPYGDSPLDEEKVGETVYMDILNRANTYVHIMTPYLILDGEMLAALQYAAKRGVDVKIILPGIPDKKVSYSLAKSHYAALLASGVKLYEYSPGFVHAKVFVSDDIKAVVGTINLDYRSLYHHFECAAYLYKTSCIPEIEADFAQTLAQCREITAESNRHERLSYRIVGHLAKMIAPLL